MSGSIDAFLYPEALNPRFILQVPFVPKEGGMEGQLNSWLLRRNTHLSTPGPITVPQHCAGLGFSLLAAHSLRARVGLLFCVHLVYRLSVVAFHIILFVFYCLALFLLNYQFILFSLFFDFKIQIMSVFYRLIFFYISYAILSFVMYLFFCHFSFTVCCSHSFTEFLLYLIFYSYKWQAGSPDKGGIVWDFSLYQRKDRCLLS